MAITTAPTPATLTTKKKLPTVQIYGNAYSLWKEHYCIKSMKNKKRENSSITVCGYIRAYLWHMHAHTVYTHGYVNPRAFIFLYITYTRAHVQMHYGRKPTTVHSLSSECDGNSFGDLNMATYVISNAWHFDFGLIFSFVFLSRNYFEWKAF